MTNVEFVEATENIENFYGKELKEFERKIWFQELKNLDISRYRQVIRQVYIDCKFMPKLADIIDINSTLNFEQKQEHIEKVDCKKCKGNGFITYTKFVQEGYKKLPYLFIAKCDCKNGENYNYDGRKLEDKANKSDYYIPNLQQINLTKEG